MNQMTPEEVRKIALEVMKTQGSVYTTARVPQHVHNGVDSPFALQPTVSFVGIIGDGGEPVVLPSGWNSYYLGAATYAIFHHLDATLGKTSPSGAEAVSYAVTFTQLDGYPLATPLLTLGTNGFGVQWLRTTTGNPQGTFFCFTMTLVQNRNTVPPTYVVR